jgi:MFS family permease
MDIPRPVPSQAETTFESVGMSKEHNAAIAVPTGPGFFYGYVIAILAFCIFLVTYGLRFSYGVFFHPMSSELGWSSAVTSSAFSISMIMEGIFNIILGRMMDRYGPRLVVTISGILVAAGYCLVPLVDSTWKFFLFYGGLIGIGMGGLFAPIVSLIPRWFTTRRNIVNGLVLSSVGIGIMVVSPLANQLILAFGWKTTFLVFGIAILLINTVCAQFLKRDPYSIGLVPFGEDAAQRSVKTGLQGLSLGEAVRTYQFWSVFFLLFAYGFSANSVNIHIVPDALKLGITATVGASILATIGLLQIAGRIGLGLVADRVGNRLIFLFGFAAFALLTLWLPSVSLTWAFFIFAAFFGLAQGGMATSQSPLVASLFGVRSLGLIFGSCGFGFTLGAALGPYLTGHIFDLSGSYKWAFIIVAILNVLAFLVALGLRPVKKDQAAKAPKPL